MQGEVAVAVGGDDVQAFLIPAAQHAPVEDEVAASVAVDDALQAEVAGRARADAQRLRLRVVVTRAVDAAAGDIDFDAAAVEQEGHEGDAVAVVAVERAGGFAVGVVEPVAAEAHAVEELHARAEAQLGAVVLLAEAPFLLSRHPGIQRAAEAVDGGDGGATELLPGEEARGIVVHEEVAAGLDGRENVQGGGAGVLLLIVVDVYGAVVVEVADPDGGDDFARGQGERALGAAGVEGDAADAVQVAGDGDAVLDRDVGLAVDVNNGDDGVGGGGDEALLVGVGVGSENELIPCVDGAEDVQRGIGSGFQRGVGLGDGEEQATAEDVDAGVGLDVVDGADGGVLLVAQDVMGGIAVKALQAAVLRERDGGVGRGFDDDAARRRAAADAHAAAVDVVVAPRLIGVAVGVGGVEVAAVGVDV